MLKKINFFLLIFFFNIFSSSTYASEKGIAFITNQESSMLDLIDLKKKKKILEINVGKNPAAIDIDQENKIIFIANPTSNNVSIYDFIKKQHFFIEAGKSPMGIVLSPDKKSLCI